MNRLNLLLAVAALAFAAVTVHYARALDLQRAQNNQTLSAGNSRSAEHPADRPIHPGFVAAQNPVADTAADDNDKLSPQASRFDPANLAYVRRQLEELRDPQARAQRVKDLVALLRDNMGYLGPFIGLPDPEMDRFLEARADKALQRKQRQLECRIDPSCDFDALVSTSQAAAEKDQADLLGPEKYARLKAYMGSSSERHYIYQFNRRLPPDSALTETQAEKFILALAEEKQKFAAEAKQNGRVIETYFSAFDTSFPISGAARPGTRDEAAERAESGARYSQRLSDRAAGLLTSRQLVEFRALLDRSLQDYQERLRENEIRAAAHQ